MVDPTESLLPQDCSLVSLRQIEGAWDRRLFFRATLNTQSAIFTVSQIYMVSSKHVTKSWGLFRWGFDEKLGQN